MKILFLTAEAGPYVSVGGLSQVSYFLTRAITELGDSIRIFTPKFGSMDKTAPKKSGWNLKTEVEKLAVPIDNGEGVGENKALVCNVKSHEKKRGGVKTYFLENREYYELRANVFGYKDDHIRFDLLCKGCLEWLLLQKKKKGAWFPDLIQCNDWHTSYLIELARTSPRYKDVLAKVPIVLTVHNFAYQGNFDFNYCAPKDKDDLTTPLAPLLSEKLLKQNALGRGIVWADEVNTVSPTHAREVMTKEYAEGLQDLLLRVRNKVSGILNGLDYKEFDPAKDPLVYKKFSVKNYEKVRKLNKAYLQEQFDLPKEKDAFLLAYSGRLASQKGLDILLESMKHLLPELPELQLVVLGGGDDSYRKELRNLHAKYPRQVGLHLLSNFALPRKIFSGADALLLPSKYEPGGIVALESLRYGAVPIIRRTGGLNDIVEDFDPTTKTGNGFSFDGTDGWGLYGAVIEAYTTYKNTSLWNKLVANCLKSDYSWKYAAKKYRTWYRNARSKRKRAVAGAPHVAYIKEEASLVR